MIFAIIGLILFAFMYVRYIEGRFFEAMQDPSTLLFFIVPFLPAIVLSFLAGRAQKKLMRHIDSDKKN